MPASRIHYPALAAAAQPPAQVRRPSSLGPSRPRQRKSKKAVTGDILAKLLQTCAGDRRVDVRDRAILLTAFASGGRRRSEVASLRVEDLVDEAPVLLDPKDPESPKLPCLTIRLGRTKTTDADDDEKVVLIGRPVIALKHWLAAAAIESGPIFRKVDQWGNIDRRAITPQTVNLVVKARARQAGLDPALFSAHGLRSGYLTEAANRGIPLPNGDAADVAQICRPSLRLLQ